MPIGDEEIGVERQMGSVLLHSAQRLHEDTARRDQLLDLTRGREGGPFDRAIDNQISRLRRKIEIDAKDPQHIKTIWGGGYRFSTEVRRL